MTGTVALVRLALRRDRGRLSLWGLGVLIGAMICAVNVADGFADEAQRLASLRVAIDNPALLIGRGLPMGTSAGAFLFYTYGVVLATVFAVFALLFAVRHGRAEEDNGTRELLSATAIGRISALLASVVAGVLALTGLAVAMVVGLVLGGADPAGSAWAGVVGVLVGSVCLAIGVLSGQLAPTSRAATGIGTTIIAAFFIIRVIADVTAHIDPLTYVGEPGLIGWLSPFSLAGLADPYGAVDHRPFLILAGSAVLGVMVAIGVERHREFGASMMRPRPGPANASPAMRTPLRLTLRLQRGTMSAMMLAGAVTGAFAAVLAVLALTGQTRNDALGEMIRTLVGGDGPLYDLLLGYVMVLVGECAAIAGVLVILRARREEVTGNVEMIRGTGTGPTGWFVSMLVAASTSILLVLTTAWLGAATVYLSQGMGLGAIGQVLGATMAQLPATVLYLGLVAVVFAVFPRLAGAVAWTILVLGVFLAELGGRLGLPDGVLAISPFTHTPLVTTDHPDWTGAVWMTIAGLAAMAFATAAYRRRDLSP